MRINKLTIITTMKTSSCHRAGCLGDFMFSTLQMIIAIRESIRIVQTSPPHACTAE
jgi:hypothetical protein